MKIKHNQQGHSLELSFIGDLDAESCNEVRESLSDLAEEPEFANLSINLEYVDFLDSSGIGLIVFLYKKLLTKEVTLELVKVHGQPLELTNLLRISKVIPISTLSNETLAS
jgi:anti-anti-sigma factor